MNKSVKAENVTRPPVVGLKTLPQEVLLCLRQIGMCMFSNRYYAILKNAGIETKGLRSLRHTFVTNLVKGVKQADGTIKALTQSR